MLQIMWIHCIHVHRDNVRAESLMETPFTLKCESQLLFWLSLPILDPWVASVPFSAEDFINHVAVNLGLICFENCFNVCAFVCACVCVCRKGRNWSRRWLSHPELQRGLKWICQAYISSFSLFLTTSLKPHNTRPKDSSLLLFNSSLTLWGVMAVRQVLLQLCGFYICSLFFSNSGTLDFYNEIQEVIWIKL